METITKNEVKFLVALNASEESSIKELFDDLGRWDYSLTDVSEIIEGLLLDGTLGLYRRSASSIQGIPLEQAINTVRKLNRENDVFLFLTAPGFQRWEVDDWGITTKRARYLMFSNQSCTFHRVE